MSAAFPTRGNKGGFGGGYYPAPQGFGAFPGAGAYAYPNSFPSAGYAAPMHMMPYQPSYPMSSPSPALPATALVNRGGYGGRGGRGKGDKVVAIKEAIAARAASSGATAQDALDCLLAVLPKKGGVALSQVGFLVSTHRPGGWPKNFAHLGTMGKFIEANPYYFTIEHCQPEPIVQRCDPESQVDDGEPEPTPEAAPSRLKAKEAVGALYALIPVGRSIQIAQLGSSLGGGGWNHNKMFAGLAKNLQSFLARYPQHFTLNPATGTVQRGDVVPETVEKAAGVIKAPLPSPKTIGPKATTDEAAAAILALLPAEGPVYLSQIGCHLGQGGWKLNYGHLGSLRSFIENNPELFIIDVSAVPAGGHPLLSRGPKGLADVPEVYSGTKSKARKADAPAEAPPMKRPATGN